MRTRLLVATFLAACTAGPAPVDTGTPTQQKPGALPTAHEVFTRTEAVYGKATSYSDRGYLAEAQVRARGTTRHRLTFTTAFVRGDRFRFEFRDKGDSERAYVVWNGAKRTRIKSFIDGNSVKDETSLEDALRNATILSPMMEWVVPTLLFPDVVHSGYLSRSDAHVDGTDWVDNRRCYKISQMVDGSPQIARSGVDWSGYVDVATTKPVDGNSPTVDGISLTVNGVSFTINGRSQVVWIDADTYVVRKIVRHAHIKSDHGEVDLVTGIHYTPVLNGTVAAADLAEPTAAPPSH